MVDGHFGLSTHLWSFYFDTTMLLQSDIPYKVILYTKWWTVICGSEKTCCLFSTYVYLPFMIVLSVMTIFFLLVEGIC